MAINLARHKSVPRHLIKQLEAIRKAIQETLIDRRNQAVHAVHLGSELPDAQRVLMVRWKGQKREAVITVDELEMIAAAIERQAGEAMDVLWHLTNRKQSGRGSQRR